LGLPFVTVVKVANLDELGRIYMRIVSNADAYRASFTVLEAVALVNRYKALLSERAAHNKSLNGERQIDILNAPATGVPNLGTPVEFEPVGNAAKVAAEIVPYGHETIRKVNRLQALASDESQSEAVRSSAVKALEEVGRTNKVDGPFRRMEDIVMAQRFSDEINASADPGGYVDVSKPWRELEAALTKAEALLRVEPTAVVSFGVTANDDHLVFLPRLGAVREWIDSYEEACR